MRRQSSGIKGLDEVIRGGFLPAQSYLVRGGPGSGKTILSLQFLEAGARDGQRTLYVSLSESIPQIKRNANNLNLDVSDVNFLDLSPSGDGLPEGGSYDVFTAGEMELEPQVDMILDRVESLDPDRIVIDGIVQFQMLSPDVYHFRKQILNFLDALEDESTTVLFTSESGDRDDGADDRNLQFLADGVIQLDVGTIRTLEVTKMRGSSFQTGKHHMRIRTGGIRVFPRLIPEHYQREVKGDPASSGVDDIDEMIGGGIERGTVTLITGPTGVGKSTLGLQFVRQMADGDEYGIIYSFEEDPEAMIDRGEAMGLPVQEHMEKGRLSLEFVEPLRYTPLEFAHLVRGQVEEKDAAMIMIDSMKGYEVGFQQDEPAASIRPLLKYLSNMGVTSLLINETKEITGKMRVSDNNISHLVDNILYLRYFREQDRLEKAFGVLKKRNSARDNGLRRVEFNGSGLELGETVNQAK